MRREDLLVDTFLQVTDTLVTDFDAHELLQTLAERCLELFDVEAAGVMLAERSGELGTVASSSREMEKLERLEIEASEGPSYDAFRESREVIVHDLAGTERKWPSFLQEASKMGLSAAYGIPLRLREHTVGAFNLYQSESGRELQEDDLRVARGLAHAATIALVQDRLLQEAEVRADQLEQALSSRVIIEQAKGVLAESLGPRPHGGVRTPASPRPEQQPQAARRGLGRRREGLPRPLSALRRAAALGARRGRRR